MTRPESDREFRYVISENANRVLLLYTVVLYQGTRKLGTKHCATKRGAKRWAKKTAKAFKQQGLPHWEERYFNV